MFKANFTGEHTGRGHHYPPRVELVLTHRFLDYVRVRDSQANRLPPDIPNHCEERGEVKEVGS